MNAVNAQSRRHRSFVAGALLNCTVLLLVAVSGVGRADDEVNTTDVWVETLSGELVNGSVRSLDDVLTVELDDGVPRQLNRGDIVRLRRSQAVEPTVETPALTLLVNGDVLAGRPVRVTDDLLMLEWTSAPPDTAVQIPLEFVRAIVFEEPPDQSDRRRLQRQWGLPCSGSDRLLLKNESIIHGELNAIDGNNVNLDTGLGPVSTSRDDVAALTLNAELAAPMPRPQEYSIVVCADGSRVTLQETAIDTDGNVTGKATFRGNVSLPLKQTTDVLFVGDHVQTLSDREPQRYEFTPFLNAEYPLVTNRNVEGGPLCVRGDCFATGLGVHSRSVVTYDLGEEGWRSFTTTIGVDDIADGGGHVSFSVVVDDTPVFESGDVSGSTEAIAVGPLDVSNARRLRLIVDFGQAGDIRDFANWCDPLLLR